MAEQRQMKRNLGWATATSIVVGCVIGAGVFFKPYAIYQATGGAPGMGILAWIIGGLVSIFAALTFSEVAILIPKTGGMVAMRLVIAGVMLGLLILLNRTVLNGMIFEGAAVMLFILPSPFIIPIFADAADERVQISSALSALTLITMVLFAVASVVVGIM